MDYTWDRDEIEINLKEIFIVLLKKSPVIILIAICIALLSYSYFKEHSVTTYTSCTKVYVLSKQNEGNITYNDVQLGAQISKDYNVLIKARPVMEKVIQKLKLSRSSGQLASQIMVVVPEDTRVLMIYVTDVNPILAMEIANSVREVASEYIKQVVNIETLNVIETADLPTFGNGSSTMKNTLISGLLAVLVMSAFFVIRFQLDDSIKNPENIEQKLGLSVLASIPLSSKRKITYKNKKVDYDETKRSVLKDSLEVNNERLAQ